MDDIPGFHIPEKTINFDDEDEQTKTKTAKKKSGGFQSMNLNFDVLKGISKRGYKQPTPIQRKAIPLILEGRDVVAMARTGSGKTAAFLLPMFNKLKTRSAKAGARALILSPTKELALQTLKFIKELGKFLNLKSAVILGGDSMEDQFQAIHGNPDIIVATPGRFLHVCIEMELKLKSIEYVVFDEADRLFEMGLSEQLTEIIHRLPDSRQTLLFSATLPKVLVEFTKAGLNDPVLLRLDVESKLPDELKLEYIIVRPNEKLAALIILLKTVIDLEKLTIIFAPTKHHVEYLHSILDKLGISNTYIYSNLDPSARKINAAKFSKAKVKVLVVTDVAARGIDIPQLDNVINYNFPAKSKLFVHRVGRCARAGRTGTAYSLVAPDEQAYLLDLHLFLGRPLSVASLDNRNGSVGKIQQDLIDDEMGSLVVLHNNHATDLNMLKKTSENAYKQYIKSRPTASADSHRRMKEMDINNCGVHALFKPSYNKEEYEREQILDKIRNYRSNSSIFEICRKKNSEEFAVMKQVRAAHKEQIENHKKRMQEKGNDGISLLKSPTNLTESTNEEISDTFKSVILPKKRKLDNLYKKKNKKMKTDNDVFIPYAPKDQHTEQGLAVNNFQNEAKKIQLDLLADSEQTMNLNRNLQRWDRKKKKMITIDNSKKGKIQTESGVWISATYKSNRYAEWKAKCKVNYTENDSEENQQNLNANKVRNPHTRWARHNQKLQQKQGRSEMKNKQQILKARELAEKKKQRKGKGKKGKGKGKRRK